MPETPELDLLDRKLLDLLQSNFPVCSRPYAKLGEDLGIAESEVISRVARLKKTGLIRRLGATFDSRKLGWVSTLCAAKVPEEGLEAFIQAVNALPGVTHNYLREHAFNVWFTLIAPSGQSLRETLAGLSRATGREIMNLPAQKLYKLKVDFSLENRLG